MSLAQKFYEAWVNIAKAREQELLRSWNEVSGFTQLVIHSDNSLVLEIAKKLDLECYNHDYYYIDSVFYKHKSRLQEIGFGCYLTDIEIAFEHENNFQSGLFQEICHLLITNTTLKVLVTYPSGPLKSDNKDKELDKLHKIVSQSRNSKKLSENDGLLLIFGYRISRGQIEWKGLLYKLEEWKSL